MLSNSLKIVCSLLFCGGLLAQTGCACKTASGECVTSTRTKTQHVATRNICDRAPGEVTAALPPNARAGECYAKVFIPATYKNVSERILVRDASETIEVIPAKYEWVEERVVVRDASKELVVVAAEFGSKERTIETNSGHTDWEINKNGLCVTPKDQPARDVYCLVTHPSARKTIQTQYQVKAARVNEVCVPAQYETVRREKLVSAATTRKVCIPAEYENVEKSVKVCDGRMAWQRIVCDINDVESASINANGKSSIATVNATRTTRP